MAEKFLASQTVKTIAIAGNPNVGKSTVFNALTGLHQHTGNWPGKTVSCTEGEYIYKNNVFKLVDIPGTYSLMSDSEEEEIARDFICFGHTDAIVVVIDATSIERNLNLVLQILEMNKRVVVCVNLIDEALKNGISINIGEMSLYLGVPVVATNARDKLGLDDLMQAIYEIAIESKKTFVKNIEYDKLIEKAITNIQDNLNFLGENINTRWLSIKLLQNDESLINSISEKMHFDIVYTGISNIIQNELNYLEEHHVHINQISDMIVNAIIGTAENICQKCVYIDDSLCKKSDRKLDKIFISKITGFPIMIMLLLGVFWITIVGANYPSEVLSSVFFYIQDRLSGLCIKIGTPEWVHGILVLGIYRTLAWVVSVMLPPMAIFFPLFTLLEDIGYLPRVAFNLDKIFRNVGAHGKQALTMCMGFGCNACGVIGCRIIDSPREKLIAILTNNFVPCNGRFPTLITIINIFFLGFFATYCQSFLASVILTIVILCGIFITFAISHILSKTILKGQSSLFTLELPPYRRPKVLSVIIRSIFDRTLFVLGRAIAVAAPAGLVIWIMANCRVNDVSLLKYCSAFLDPFGKLIGLDGVILMSFILGFPANEIVIPIMIMSYMSAGSIMELENIQALRLLLVNNGWSHITAISMMIFTIMHFPCGTTLWTIKKETGSIKWTMLSFVIPTVTGIVLSFIVSNILRIFAF